MNTFREVEPVLRKISVCDAEILAFVQKAAIREKKKEMKNFIKRRHKVHQITRESLNTVTASLILWHHFNFVRLPKCFDQVWLSIETPKCSQVEQLQASQPLVKKLSELAKDIKELRKRDTKNSNEDGIIDKRGRATYFRSVFMINGNILVTVINVGELG